MRLFLFDPLYKYKTLIFSNYTIIMILFYRSLKVAVQGLVFMAHPFYIHTNMILFTQLNIIKCHLNNIYLYTIEELLPAS
jgi:hypothetical protein